ncbi:hypothetical protein CLF_100003 [Clonorchis sinensis]|uniref:Uncharacterized protein n=1 Tax=Clonorchis sinensis TaxID=79923 RepID=G7Y2G3_CLOSI|nr:hypothetical protein CLF_100003 [Clonorchis sinensis]
MYSLYQKTCHAERPRGGQCMICQRSMKILTSKLSGIDNYRIHGWGPRDSTHHRSSSAKLDSQAKEYKSLNAALGELHYELLLCSVDTTSPPSTSSGHRHGSGSNPISTSSGSSAGSTTFANWSLSCFRKQQPTKDYHYLELFVQHISERCLKPIDTQVSSCPTSELHLKQSSLDIREDLAITRAVEFLQLAWISGRLRNLGIGQTEPLNESIGPLPPTRGSHSLILLIVDERSCISWNYRLSMHGFDRFSKLKHLTVHGCVHNVKCNCRIETMSAFKLPVSIMHLSQDLKLPFSFVKMAKHLHRAIELVQIDTDTRRPAKKWEKRLVSLVGIKLRITEGTAVSNLSPRPIGDDHYGPRSSCA